METVSQYIEVWSRRYDATLLDCGGSNYFQTT